MSESAVSSSKMLSDAEIRHITGRLKYAMDWIMTLQRNPLGLTSEQNNNARLAVFRSAGDVAPLLGEVGLLRSLLNESSGYLLDLIKDPNTDPEAKIVALTTISLMQIQVPTGE